MNIILDYTSELPMYEQIEKAIKNEIIEGKLKENDILPSVRKLAKELNTSTITIKRAYLELEKAKITYSVSGIGTFIKVKTSDELINENKKKLYEELNSLIRRLKINKGTKEEIFEKINKLWEDENNERSIED